MSDRIGDMRKRETSELLSVLDDKRKECFNIRFQRASEKATNPQLLRTLRRDVARIKTVLRERELRGEG